MVSIHKKIRNACHVFCQKNHWYSPEHDSFYQVLQKDVRSENGQPFIISGAKRMPSDDLMASNWTDYFLTSESWRKVAAQISKGAANSCSWWTAAEVLLPCFPIRRSHKEPDKHTASCVRSTTISIKRSSFWMSVWEPVRLVHDTTKPRNVPKSVWWELQFKVNAVSC